MNELGDGLMGSQITNHCRQLAYVTVFFLVAWTSTAQALSFPPEFRGGWCSPGSRDPEFFIDPQGATEGIIECKLRRIEMDQRGLRASLMCTNATGRFVEPMPIEIAGGRLRVGNHSTTRLWKCL